MQWLESVCSVLQVATARFLAAALVRAVTRGDTSQLMDNKSVSPVHLVSTVTVGAPLRVPSVNRAPQAPAMALSTVRSVPLGPPPTRRVVRAAAPAIRVPSARPEVRKCAYLVMLDASPPTVDKQNVPDAPRVRQPTALARKCVPAACQERSRRVRTTSPVLSVPRASLAPACPLCSVPFVLKVTFNL